MQISPFENGVHSLAEGLKYLNEYLLDTTKQYSLKGAIINIHHGIETLLKDALFQRNPIFVLGGKTTVNQAISRYKDFLDAKNNYIFDDEFTITPIDALARTKELRVGEIKERDYQALFGAFERLNILRNQLQHFALRADPQSVIKIFGDLVPKAVKYLTSCYTFDVGAQRYVLPHYPIRGMEYLFQGGDSLLPHLHRFYPDAGVLIDLLQSKYDVMLNEAFGKFKKKVFSSVVQLIEIDSHGEVGAPPYYPSIKLSGWINETFMSHENSTEAYGRFRMRQSSATYTASVQIDPPIILEKKDSYFGNLVEHRINLSCEAIPIDIPKLIALEECNEYLEFLRDAKVTIVVNLRFQGWAGDLESNYRLDEITNPEGEVTIMFSSGVFGDPNRKQEISLKQEFSISSKNIMLRFDGFGTPANFLNHRHSLSLKIDGCGDIISN